MPGRRPADDDDEYRRGGSAGPADRLIRSETESEIETLVCKMRQTSPLERKQVLKKLIKQAKTSDDIAIIRRVVERCSLLVELREIQQETEKPVVKRGRGRTAG